MNTSLTHRRPDFQYWQRFQSGLCSDEEIAGDVVLQRWKRCRDAGLSADNPGEPLMALTGLGETVNAFAPLLAPGAPFDAFATAIANDGFCCVFSDHQGRVLSSRVADAFRRTVVSQSLTEGALWSEGARGTNGIGTTLLEQRPVTIVGPEHYELRNHVFACYGAPIRDVRERVIAVLDATGPADCGGSFIHVSVVATAAALEALIVGRTYDAAHPGGLFSLERLLDGMPHAALLLETSGRIRRVNTRFRSLVSERDQEALGRTLASVPMSRRHASSPLPSSLQTRDDLVAEFESIGKPEDPFAAIVHLRKRSERRAVRRASIAPPGFKAIVGSDPAIVAARDQAARFARADLPMLVLGETGTGKELFARAIHAAGARASGSFVAVNAGALTGTLLESELFGYGPGAFTGAAPGGRTGRLEAAHGGTLFLDEIGEMSPHVQALLLRFLEDGWFYRVGESAERHADVRVVAATNRDLAGLVDERRFRADLFFRLRGVVLRLPPLRERTDRRELAEALLDRIAPLRGLPRAPELSTAALAWIERHDWPGNVRELRTALEYGVVLAAGAPRLDVWHLPIERPQRPGDRHDLLLSAERDALMQALERSHGNLSATARALGVARSTMYRMLARHGVGK